MLIRFAYLKLQRPNQTTFSPGTAVTTYIQSPESRITPLGAAGTSAPSTLITDTASGNRYYLNKPFSAVHAALTAATADNANINLI